MSTNLPVAPLREEPETMGISPSNNLADLVDKLRSETSKVISCAQNATENFDAVTRVASNASAIVMAIASTGESRLKQQTASDLFVQQFNLIYGLIRWFGVNLQRDASLAFGAGNSLVIFGWLKIDNATLSIRNIELYEEIFTTMHDLFQVGNGGARLIGDFNYGSGLPGVDAYSDIKTLSWLAPERSPLAMTVKLLARAMSTMNGSRNVIPHLLLQIVLVIKVTAIAKRNNVLIALTFIHFDVQRSLLPLEDFSKVLNAIQDRVCLAINALLSLHETINANSRSMWETHMSYLVLNMSMVVFRLRILEAVVAVDAAPHTESLLVMLEALLDRTKNCERAIRVSQHSYEPTQFRARRPAPTPIVSLLVPSLPPQQATVRGRAYLIDLAVGWLDDIRTTYQVSKQARLGLRDLVALTGRTGMGKTTVALAILRDQRVVDIYGVHRLFFCCEAFSDFQDLASALEGYLTGKTSHDPLNSITNNLTSRGKVLIVFDALESDRFSAPSSNLEIGTGLFSSIRLIPGVVMIITARVLPPIIATSGDIIHSLEPLLPTTVESSCRDIFTDAAEMALAPDQRDTVDVLLRLADHLPLAAALLGRCMYRGTPLSKLMESWSAVAYRLATPSWDNPSSSSSSDAVRRQVVPAVAVAVALEMLEKDNPEAVKLLAIFSLLPDGVQPGILSWMREDHRTGRLDLRRDIHFDDFDKAVFSLKESRLVCDGGGGHLRVIQAVREREDGSVTFRTAVRQIACDIALSFAIPNSRLDLVPRRTPALHHPAELTNLRAILTVDRGDVQANACADALVTLAGRCRDAPSTIPMLSGLFQSLQSELRPQQNALLEGRCCAELGRCNASQGDWTTAAVWFERACSAYRRLEPTSVDLWASLLSLALCDIRRSPSDPNAAFNSAVIAMQGYQSVSDAFGGAKAQLYFGIVLTAQADFDYAERVLKDAEEEFSRLDSRDGIIACQQALGELAAVSGDLRFSAAEAGANEESSLSSPSGSIDDPILVVEAVRSRFLSILTFETDTIVGDRLSLSESVKAAYFQDDDRQSISTFNSHLL